MTHFHIEHPPHDSDAAWQSLVSRLREGIDVLVGEYVDELIDSGIYSGFDVSRADMVDAASRIFRIFAEQLAGREDGDRAVEVARMLANSRARRGVSLEALVFAIQLDFPLFWRCLVRLAEPGENQALIDHVELLHRVINNYVLAARDEFLRERAKIVKDRTIVTRQYLSRLFGEDPVSAAELETIATNLGVASADAFTLAIAHPTAARSLQAATEHLQEAGDCFGFPLGRTSCVFWVPTSCVVERHIREAGFSAVVYPPVHTLHDVRQAAHGADALIVNLDDAAGLVPAADLLPPVLGAAVDDYVPGLRQQLIDKLRTLGDDERDRLIQIVEIYLTTGSTKGTARRAQCHRNTVINRIRQFEQLTGFDVMIPRDAALSLMLLRSTAT